MANLLPEFDAPTLCNCRSIAQFMRLVALEIAMTRFQAI